MLQLAVRHADIWSWYVEERSDLTEFGPRLAAMLAACEAAGRDPATIGRSAGRGDRGRHPVFGAARYQQVELLLWPPTLAALEAMAPVLELLDVG
jgi:hypothetical protein